MKLCGPIKSRTVKLLTGITYTSYATQIYIIYITYKGAGVPQCLTTDWRTW
jgi:hypothetical protein